MRPTPFTIAAIAASLPMLITQHVHAFGAVSSLIISEYIEGTSNNKGLELYNATNVMIDLGVVSAQVRVYANGSASPTSTISLAGTIAPGGTFVIAHTQAVFAGVADLTSGSLSFNGDDAVALVLDATIVDSIGQIGVDPGSFWGTAPVTTLDNTLRRMPRICIGDMNPSDPYDPVGEWLAFGTDVFTGLGMHDSDCLSTPCPADIDNSGHVTVSDLLLVINGWGACADPCPPTCVADTNDDCSVNVTDLLAVINGWGPCP